MARRGTPRAQVHLRLPLDLRDDLLAAARDAGVSLNVYAEAGLRTFLAFLRTESEYQPHDH